MQVAISSSDPMTPAIGLLQSFFNWIPQLGPELQCGLVMIMLGYFLKLLFKAVKKIFNVKWLTGELVPIIVIGASCWFYCAIVRSVADAPFDVANPMARNAGVGFIIGVIAWAAHNRFLSAFDRWLGSKLSKESGDTTITVKQ